MKSNAESSTADFAIIGGGIMGNATAYFLKAMSPPLSVTVIEPDPTYEFCSTLRASGGARRFFSCPENIEMSNFSFDFIKSFPEMMAVVEGRVVRDAPVDWVEGGYFFIVTPEGMHLLESNYKVQRAHGCDVVLMTPHELKTRFPSMCVDDLGGGVHSPRDGWCDPNGLLQAFKRKTVSLGVTCLKDRVTSLARSGAAIIATGLASGARVRANAFVNAAGAWSGEVSALADLPLPVVPMRRFEHYFTCGNPIQQLAYVKDTTRLAFRSEGVGFSGGLVDRNEQRGFYFDVDRDYFERVVWPVVAHRFPAFESAK